MLGSPVSWQLNEVEEKNGESNDQGLPHLNAIDASQNVDGVGAEDSQHPHVDKVHNP